MQETSQVFETCEVCAELIFLTLLMFEKILFFYEIRVKHTERTRGLSNIFV
ncbi:hypothetical protein U14_02384 [Candidatus Moduliflexus flocculans]|uniref:Uncharacterized protein n=1 Tax=Candidatus Moduliflexus flocculans TaxID=1499966 RepID=A0A081BL76_9BACT|nr:hypothetical protein U14_02384 [Candidatus Moduliflexus flocculans]